VLKCRASAINFAAEIEAVITRQPVSHVEPGDPLRIKDVVGWNERVGVVECTDVELEDLSALGKIAFPLPG
jgi:hypothetical protein